MRFLIKHISLTWKYIIVLFQLCTVCNVNAQLTFLAGYSYLHNKDLDKVFQLYNTSRQWQENALKPLTHGAETTLGYNVCLNKKRQLHVVPQLGYGYSMTTISNSDFRITTGIHRADASAQFRFHPRALIKGVHNTGPLGPRWFMTMTPGYSFAWPFVRMDGDVLENDKEVYRPKSFVFFASAGIGHHLVMLKERIIVTPEVSATWYPYIEVKDYPESINGHNLFGYTDTFENVFFFQAKLRFTFIKKVTNWWDNPARGDN